MTSPLSRSRRPGLARNAKEFARTFAIWLSISASGYAVVLLAHHLMGVVR